MMCMAESALTRWKCKRGGLGGVWTCNVKHVCSSPATLLLISFPSGSSIALVSQRFLKSGLQNNVANATNKNPKQNTETPQSSHMDSRWSQKKKKKKGRWENMSLKTPQQKRCSSMKTFLKGIFYLHWARRQVWNILCFLTFMTNGRKKLEVFSPPNLKRRRFYERAQVQLSLVANQNAIPETQDKLCFLFYLLLLHN